MTNAPTDYDAERDAYLSWLACIEEMRQRPRVLDLFAGIGGWSLGMERAGFTTSAMCELDDWKRGTLSKHFPMARLYTDVRQLTGAGLAADGIVPDIVVGSPPCTEYSAANSKGRGLDGDGLFLEFVRLVAEIRPRWACAENSPRIRTKGFDRIAGELESCGYTVRPFVLGADDIGAPHIRKRAWIIANATSRGDIGSNISTGIFRQSADTNSGQRETIWQGIGSDTRPELAALGRAVGTQGMLWGGGPGGYLDVGDGLSGAMARRWASAAGDAILPQISEIIGRSILAVDLFGRQLQSEKSE